MSCNTSALAGYGGSVTGGVTATEIRNWTMDLTQDIGADDDWGKRLHLGAEIAFPMILSLRAGLNQGYLTGGLGLDFKVLRFDLATYGEEVGDEAGDHVSRRYLAQLTIGW